jgi:hypothetical protein
MEKYTMGMCMLGAVQLERDDGGPARRRQTDNLGAVVGPTEVNMPVLGAGIEQRFSISEEPPAASGMM